MLDRLLCWLGVHGPNWFGADNSARSRFSGIYVRRCTHCGTTWHGEQVGGPSEWREIGWRRAK